jgi:hypothetical protein
LGTDIELDSNGNPQIVYQEYEKTSQRSVLKLLAWSGSAWLDLGVVSQASHNGCAPSLEVDGDNLIYIAYNDCDYIHDNLVLAIFDGSWHYQPVDPAAGTSNASLYVSNVGFVYISYSLYAYPSSTLRYARKEGAANWSIENVAPISTTTNTSLDLDSSGNPRIAFMAEKYPDYALKHAYWDGQAWQVEPVMDIVYYSEARLAIDAQDRSHLAFANWYHPSYAVKETTGWEVTDPIDRPPADPDTSFAPTRSMAIDFGSGGLPIIVYNGESDLKVAQMVIEYLAFLPISVK